MFDAIIIGGGAAGMQCALVIGSAHKAVYAKDKKVGIVMHQKTSHLQTALFNNVLGIAPGTTGMQILKEGKEQLAKLYPHVIQIEKEKVLSVTEQKDHFIVGTNKNSYATRLAVIAVGYTDFFNIEGLKQYVEPHSLSPVEKNRIQLKNYRHLIKNGLYVAGTLAGWRSQFAIASGSGAQVATDILTLWNNGKHTKVHDKIDEPSPH